MNDRELLELAASAAGLFLVGYDEVTGKGIAATERPIKNLPFGWNPITDDGDALRLAVKLGIDLWIGEETVEARSCEGCVDEIFMDDPYAATRRAIVRAAAAIGKEMT